MNKLTRYAPEVRERAVRMVLDHQGNLLLNEYATVTSSWLRQSEAQPA